MIPENIELRIKDMTTLSECIEEAKVCLSICQPSSLISWITTLTVAPLEPTTPFHQCSPSPMRRNQNNTNTQNRQCRQRQRLPILKRSTFQGFRQYPCNARPQALSNSRNNFPNTRFRSLSRSNFRPRFGNFNQPVECYYCHHMGHTANNCFRRQNRKFPRRQQIKVGEIILEIPNDTQNTELILDIEMTMLLSTELISQGHLCIQIYIQGIINRCWFGGSHFQRNFRPHWGSFSDANRWYYWDWLFIDWFWTIRYLF